MARISAWLADRLAVRPGGPPALFVSGESGVGKTALVTAALGAYPGASKGTSRSESVHEGALVARWAYGAPWHPQPYGVLRQLVGERAGRDPGAIRAALIEAGCPVLLIIDDLHWSDEATLDLLPALVDAVAGDPVAIIAAYRSDELPRGSLVRGVRAQLRHRRQLTELPLTPLDSGALAQLIASTLAAEPTPSLVQAVAERTEGVPFFVEELLAALETAGALVADGPRTGLAATGDLPLPDSVRDAVLLHASGLSEPARSVLDVAAVIGVEFDAALAAELADLAVEAHATPVGGEGADLWPDEIDHCGLIAAGPAGRRRFRHALAHEAIYAEVPWSRRRFLHRAVADRLIAADGPAGVIARHLLAGRELDRARPALIAAADEHWRSHAYRDAARLLSTALEHWPNGVDEPGRLVVVDRLARCAELSGDHPRAVTGLRELVEWSTVDGSAPDGPAQVLRRLAVQYELLGHWPPALAAREAAADAFARIGQPAEAAVERLAVAVHLRSAATFRAALETLDAAQVDATAAGRDDLVSRIGGLRGNVLARMGRADEALPQLRAALELALTGDHTAAAAEIYQRLADSLEHAGDYRGASRAYDEAYAFCQRNDQDTMGQLCRACATVVLFHSGQWEAALRLSDEVLGDGRASPHARAVATGVAGLVHALRGETARARANLLESRSLARRIDLVAMELLSTWGLALLDEGAQRYERAAESYRHVLIRCRETEERHYCVPILQYAVARFAQDGAPADLGAATALLAEAVAATGQPEARAAFAYAAAEAGPDAAELRRAVELLEGLNLPVVEMLVRQRAALAVGEPEEAVRLLRPAYRMARRLRAGPVAQTLRADLARLGAPPEESGLLTRREAETLRLVGDGLTSRAIGERLHLSVRTVEMHISHAMTKLGCRTRAEAVQRFTALSGSR
jgi:DNA-binding CsgD family transcriptional regulator/tetratricopeptide (TPR) repeat protein